MRERVPVPYAVKGDVANREIDIEFVGNELLVNVNTPTEKVPKAIGTELVPSPDV